MILLFGYADDPAITLAAEALAELEIDHFLIDQRHAGDIDLCVGSAARLEGAGWCLPLSEVTAVYARPLAPRRSGDAAADARGEALAELFTEWLDATDAIVVSRPSDMASNSSKPFQARVIADAGFGVPRTLITNDPDRVRVFAAEHGPLIFKSISGIRSIVRTLDDGALGRLDLVRALPTQFQALVPGIDVRVHVVGDVVFATQVCAEGAVDYRYAAREGKAAALEQTTVPPEVATRCVDLAQRLQLPLAGIDLRRPRADAAADEYVCFEVNPMPGYSYYESNTGQPISIALARYLADSRS